eukprot:UN03605
MKKRVSIHYDDDGTSSDTPDGVNVVLNPIKPSIHSPANTDDTTYNSTPGSGMAPNYSLSQIPDFRKQASLAVEDRHIVEEDVLDEVYTNIGPVPGEENPKPPTSMNHSHTTKGSPIITKQPKEGLLYQTQPNR